MRCSYTFATGMQLVDLCCIKCSIGSIFRIYMVSLGNFFHFLGFAACTAKFSQKMHVFGSIRFKAIPYDEGIVEFSLWSPSAESREA